MNQKINLNKNRILSLIRENQHKLRKFKVKRIGLFGSYAIGKQNKSSDIDFIVEFEEPTFDNFMNLVNYLEELFGRKVDVLTPYGIESIKVKSVAESIKKGVVYVQTRRP